MAQYIQLGNDWFNVDKLVRVHVNKDANGEVTDVVMHFQAGQPHKVRGQEALDLIAYLEKSKAP